MAFAHGVNAESVVDIGRSPEAAVDWGKGFWCPLGQAAAFEALRSDSASTDSGDSVQVQIGGKGGKSASGGAPSLDGTAVVDLPPPTDSMRALVGGLDIGALLGDSISPEAMGDSLRTWADSLGLPLESLLNLAGLDLDSLGMDSLISLADLAQAIAADTFFLPFSPDALDGDVAYSAVDSILYDIAGQMVYLYGEAKVSYQSFNLDAEYIEFNWANQTVSAWGIEDTSGTVVGKPAFVDGDQGFTADTVRFNFKTGIGRIANMRAEEQGGFIGFEQSKRNQYEEIYGWKGYYTTCSDPEPHFHIQANKVKLVPDKLVVTGPANLRIADVPTPLVLPFALFPLQKGRSSGLLLPEYGESQGLGFYLRNGGWYFAINDYWDLAMTGDIYTRGSWRVNASTNYRKRYRYSGRFTANYANTRFNFPQETDFRVTRDFKITWNHNQDPKARPNSRFTANVTAGTSTFLSNAVQNNDEFLNNSFTSNVTYTKTFPGKPYRLEASLQHNQVLATRSIDLTLPKVAFTVNRIKPFERAVQTGGTRWYEQIAVSYTAEARNEIRTTDSLLFKPQVLDAFRYGMRHTVPLNFSMPIFKHFTFAVNATYNENWYPETIRRTFVLDSLYNDQDSAIAFGFVRTDTVQGFSAARFFTTSASVSTQLFSMFQFRGKKLKAIRHVMTPSLNASYTPDFSEPFWNYYGTYATDLDGTQSTFSKFEGGLFGGPGRGRVGSLGFSLNNTLQAKVFDRKDTVDYERKVQLLDAFSLSGNYNFAADSFQWSDIRISGRTRLLERIDINFSGNFDPYSRNADGVRQQESEWKANRRLVRFRSGTLNIGTRFSGGKTATGKDRPAWLDWSVWDNSPGYIDFNVPWSTAVNYNLTVRNNVAANGGDSISTTQTLTFSGDLSLTPKWKINWQSGYDFQRSEFTYTTIGINRDLHCWQMAFNWVPFGSRRSYNFTINVKSAILQQLRINRRQDWVDDF